MLNRVKTLLESYDHEVRIVENLDRQIKSDDLKHGFYVDCVAFKPSGTFLELLEAKIKTAEPSLIYIQLAATRAIHETQYTPDPFKVYTIQFAVIAKEKQDAPE